MRSLAAAPGRLRPKQYVFRVPEYKFLGPHMGVLYGRYDLLDQLRAYKVCPAEDVPPDRFEKDIKNHEGLAGLLVGRMIEGLTEIPGLTLYGITDSTRFDGRAPTVAFTLEGYTPRQVAERLGEEGIFV